MNKYLAKIIANDQEGLQMISACISGSKTKVENIKYLAQFRDIKHVSDDPEPDWMATREGIEGPGSSSGINETNISATYVEKMLEKAICGLKHKEAMRAITPTMHASSGLPGLVDKVLALRHAPAHRRERLLRQRRRKGLLRQRRLAGVKPSPASCGISWISLASA